MRRGYLSNVLVVFFFSQLTIVTVLPQSSALNERLKKFSPRIERSTHPFQYVWPDVCTEFRRSRIDLNLDVAEAVSYDHLIFNDYDLEGPVVVENYGYNVAIKGFRLWEHPPSVTGGNLNETYYLQQIVFWPRNEHTFDGVDYHAEFHLVHLSNQYDQTRKNNPSGNLAVVAVPVLAGDGEAELEQLKPLYQAKTAKEQSVSPYSGKSDPTSFKSHALLPWDISTYYRYTGSLATPPCAEDGVTWIVMQKPIVVSTAQLKALKNAHLSRNPKNVRKGRPSKLINGRSGKLYLNKKGKESISMEQIGDFNDTLASNEVALAIILVCAVACTFAWWEFCYRSMDDEHRMLAVPLN